MAGKLVKHKLHEDWGIGEVDSNPLTYEGKIAVTFNKAKGTLTNTIKRRSFCKPENLIPIGFYD